MESMKYALAALFAAAGMLWGQQSLQIVTDTLPDATVGAAYLQQLTTSGGNCQGDGTASSTVDGGSLPPGLSVTSPSNTKQWSIAGTPNLAGTFTFTVHVSFTLTRRTPFVPDCTDTAVKSLTLTVGSGQAATTLAVDRPQVNVTYRIAHFPPPDEKVQLTASGFSATTFTTAAKTATGGNWLSVSPLASATPATLSLSFSPPGLATGVYTGSVTITPAAGAPLTIAVTLTVVVDSTTVLVASPASFSFSSLAGAPAPPAQTVKITVSGDSVIFAADVNAAPNGKWLTVTPSASATPSVLTIAVDPKTLTTGTYSGTIALHLSGVGASSQIIPVTYTISAAPTLPAISANGVVNAGNLGAAIAPGAWVSVYGVNLSATTRPWATVDFANGKLPLALDNVAVIINGKAAPVAYVSPSQINVLAPDDSVTGLVAVQVKSPAGTSDSALVLLQTAAPAFFQFRGGATMYVAGTHADGSTLAGPALTQQGVPGTPAKPGEIIQIYGTGFGATQPAISATALVPAPLPIANPQDLRIRIGGQDATVAYAGLISPGLYQVNVVVPQLADGDYAVIAELRGLLTSPNVMLTVQH
uniref:IPT/TIG domain-containing protein n=1 Tax=Solibacter usitatus (strain Ellin6076) TaxID=234267 RepID=Q02AE4_SOLUE